MRGVWAVVLFLAAALATAAPASASLEIAPPAPPPSEETNIGDVVVTPPAPPPAPPGAVREVAALSFELTVEGDPPGDALFYGVYGYGVEEQSLDYLDAAGFLVPLHDYVGGYPAGDGVLNVFTYVDRFEPTGYGTRNIPRPVPPYAEPASLPVQIVQATPDYELTRVIKDFGTVKLDGDKTFAASASFNGGGGGSDNKGGGNGSDNDGGGSGSDNDVGSDDGGFMPPAGNVFSGLLDGRLPETGGGWAILLIAGAILIASGWLLVRLARRLNTR